MNASLSVKPLSDFVKFAAHHFQSLLEFVDGYFDLNISILSTTFRSFLAKVAVSITVAFTWLSLSSAVYLSPFTRLTLVSHLTFSPLLTFSLLALLAFSLRLALPASSVSSSVFLFSLFRLELTFQLIDPFFNTVRQPSFTCRHQHFVGFAKMIHPMLEPFVRFVTTLFLFLMFCPPPFFISSLTLNTRDHLFRATTFCFGSLLSFCGRLLRLTNGSLSVRSHFLYFTALLLHFFAKLIAASFFGFLAERWRDDYEDKQRQKIRGS